MSLPIIGIERLRIATDGTGIRTLIGTYGCPLRCAYCLNPQSWSKAYTPKLYEPGDVYNAIKIDNIYFRATNGGITIGGGEPLLHIDEIEKLLLICPKEWSRWVETSLYVDEQSIVRAAALFDHFIVDIKTLDAEIYRKYTSGNVSIALGNLQTLLSIVGSERITVRVPQIPGYVDARSQQDSINKLQAIGIENIDAFVYSANIKK